MADKLSHVFADSSAIAFAAYHPDRGALDIGYRGGDRYTYFEVPPEIYEALLAAESAGEFVNRAIKPHFRVEVEQRRRRFRPPED